MTPRRRATALFAFLLCGAFALGRPTWAQEAWVPVDLEAATELARADAEVATALEGGADAELAWERAFEAWSRLLDERTADCLVPTGARDASGALRPELAGWLVDTDESFDRRHEALTLAIQRRLAACDLERRSAWRARRGPRAAAAWEALPGDPAARTAELGRIERAFPGTRAAVRAALERFGRALESGRPWTAASWLERAAHDARLADDEVALNAVERRRALLEPQKPRPRAASEAWARASRLEAVMQHPLVLPGYAKPRSFARVEGPAGFTSLADGRAVVQAADRVWILGLGEEDRSYDPWELPSELGMPPPVTADRPGREWPHFPTTDGEQVIVVAGRADGTTSNLVQCALPPHELELPEVRWSLGGDGLYDATRRLAPLEEVLGPGLWEFQPGLLLVDDLVLVQARHWAQNEEAGMKRVSSPGEARAWLLALELGTGRPRWRTLLARGTDVKRDLGLRFGRGELIRTPGTPPVRVGTRVFVGTNLGVALALELADGRVTWGLRHERRAAERPGWEGPEAPLVDGEVVLWGPRDSDHLLVLSCPPDWAGSSQPLLVRPPAPMPEARRLVGGDRERVLVEGLAGARRTLSTHELESGRRFDSVYLGREERFLGAPLVSDSRVLCLTDRGLYRFDRERELYLEEVTPVELSADWASGGLHAVGDLVYALAAGGLYVYRAR